MPLIASLTTDKQREAVQLYRSGCSAQQVADTLGVGIDAVFYTLRKHNVERRSIAESNRIRFEAKPYSYSIKDELTDEEERLKQVAVMLYWAEGYKVGNVVDFANSDVKMALIFKKFLSQICRVDEERIRCSLYCYEGQDVKALTTFWSRALQVPESQFIKPHVKKQSIPGPRGSRMTSGLVHIRYCDTKLLRQILSWIDEYADICVGGRVVNCEWL